LSNNIPHSLKEIIKHHKFPHLLLLEASAGSGKTEALAKRYVWFILAEGKVPHNDISNILAITFTKKAAREMKQRILEQLKKLALNKDVAIFEETVEQLGIPPEELQSLAEANVSRIIERYSDFQIQTIDSFMARVARSAALELDLRPDFEITMTYGELQHYSIALMLRQVGSGRNREITAMIDQFLDLLNQLARPNFIWNPELELEKKFSEFLGVESKEIGNLVFEDRRNEIQQCRETISQIYEAVKALPLPKKEKYVEKFDNDLKRGNIGEILRRTYSQHTVPVRKGKGSEDETELYENAEREWLGLIPVVGRLATFDSLSRCHAYGEVYREFKSMLQSVKLRTGVHHISDISKILNQYLNEAIVPEIYLGLGQRLYHFLIDEFQDTDPVQWASLSPLLYESLAKDGSLFLVGDLKQAIYMFRRADYRIMRGLVQEIKGEISSYQWLPPSVRNSAWVDTLGKNYRSGEVILQYVEEVFKNNLKDVLGKKEFQRDLTGLTDFVQDPTPKMKGKGYARTMPFVRRAKEEDEADAAPERKALLGIINDVLNRGYRHRDIGVLAAKNRELAMIVDWLITANIRASASSSLDIRKRKVISEIVELLKFLESPVDDLAFANFILGDVMARAVASRGIKLNSKELHQMILDKGNTGRGYLYQTFRKHAESNTLWEGYFENLYQKTGYYPLYDLVSMALRAFRIFDNFPEESGSLVKLLEAVNILESKGKNSIQDFLEETADEKTELFNLELPEYADAVRLMTFHKAKGLGFPVVINMIYESRPPSNSTYYDKEGEKIRVHYITKDLAKKSPDLAKIYERRVIDNQIQHLNTLYVMCTRAKWELYNLVVLSKQNGLLGTLFKERELGQKTEKEKQDEPLLPSPTSVKLKHGTERDKEWGRDEGWSYTRWVDAKRGEVYHKILETIEFLSGPSGKKMTDIMDRCPAITQTPFDSEQIRSDIESFLSYSEVRGWFEPVPGRIVFREKEYVDKSGNLYRMDRVIIDEDEVTVIDFKTGELKDYSEQLKKYMHVLGEIYPDRKVNGYVAYVDSSRVEEIK